MAVCMPLRSDMAPARPGEALHFDDLARMLAVEEFEAQAARLIRRFDRDNVRIVCSWRRAPRPRGPSAVTNLLAYYRAEVRRIPVMDREEELRFCMGLELLWRRLKKARRGAGFAPEDVERWPGDSGSCPTCPPGTERTCYGCAPADLPAGVRARLRDRNQEFEAARNELIERNLHIVFRLLERYRSVVVPMEDMIQEANFSLFKAVENFDFTRGVRFKTYAAYWVNQAFLNAIYNQSRTVRVPAYIQKAMKKINDAASAVGAGTGDLEALSRESGVPVDLVQTAISGNRFTLSLDRALDEGDDGSRIVDCVSEPISAAAPEAGDEKRLAAHLSQAVRALGAREQLVLRLRYGLDGERVHTLAEVGERLCISLERVRQIQKGALEKLRRSDQSRLLEQFA